MLCGNKLSKRGLLTLSCGNVMLGVRKYGTDFSAIAEVIGNKMPSHVRNFFITYRQQFRLDDMLHDNEHDLSSVRNTKIIRHNDAQPPEVSASFQCTSL